MSLGMTLVSHVSEIAEGLPKLLNQVAKDVPITTAGGTNDGDIGTSMEKIMKAFDDNKADEILAFYDVALVEGAYTAASLLQAGVGLEEVETQLKPLKIKD